MSCPRHRSMLSIVVLASSALLACESKKDPSIREPAGAAASSNLVAFAGTARVEVTKDGFQPNRVVVGSDRKVTFRRTSDATCATAVVFPEVGIEKQLPLNSDVVIELPASAPRELSFQCGMGMYKSKVVVD
jgi:plastocyanin domain-containing protein